MNLELILLLFCLIPLCIVYGNCLWKIFILIDVLKNHFLFYFTVSFEDSQYDVVPLTAEKVLEFIEQAYPNPITPEDLAR